MNGRLSGDAEVRAQVDGLPVFEFETVPFAAPRPLRDARVAIVTTAGLRSDGVHKWDPGDESFTVLPADERDLALAHMSPNFDRTGFLGDLNVVYPVDRLQELSVEGVIGSVAPRHLSFMGAQPNHDLATMRLDTGPKAATLLKDDGVDVVLLTPV